MAVSTAKAVNDYRVHLTLKSSNRKTGPIPVSTTTRATCPDRCGLKSNGCYAEGGPIKIHWDRVTRGETGMSWDEFCEKIKELPENQIWRHNQAGDLPGDGMKIDEEALMKLARANNGRDGFTYTHYDVLGETEFGLHNWELCRSAAHYGFIVNISVDRLEEAVPLFNGSGGLPVTTILPPGVTGTFWKPHISPHHGEREVKVVTCPATYKEDVNCMTCKLCANPNRDHIIGFPAHGTGAKKIVAWMAAERMGV